MTTTQRHVAGFTAVGLVVLLSWLTISPGTPQIYAPLNLLVVIPAFMSSDLFADSYLLAIGVVPVFFCLWCWPVLRGGTTVPIRSVVLLILAVVLSAAGLNICCCFLFTSDYDCSVFPIHYNCIYCYRNEICLWCHNDIRFFHGNPCYYCNYVHVHIPYLSDGEQHELQFPFLHSAYG